MRRHIRKKWIGPFKTTQEIRNMVRIRGHFDGNQVVLDEPAPEELKPNTPVEIVVLDMRTKALAERRGSGNLS
jgi:hypothetical protein